ncbi:regenerating islet-derived protein 4 [Castor canadensis]|uniref:Regenerating islet-derived protein 4 n=1 Tax=Castor canadensis TaxID=51338 RepID=A0AC58KQF1_CASCN
MACKGMRLLFLLSCIISPEVLGGTEIIIRPSCASGWFYYQSNCYGYFQKLRNWSEAELECQLYGNGTHLASVLDLKEASVIAEYISGYQKVQPFWIGLHDPQKRQLWQWIDGTMYLYKTWKNRSTSGAKHCAEISPKDNFLTWNQNECKKRQHFLCKYRP